MRPVRTLAALTMQSALLIMSLIGNGFACGADADHSAHMAMAADMDMSGMDMGDMPGMPRDPAGGGQDRSNPDSDCSFPWSSGDCQGMASCAPNVMGVEQPSVSVVLASFHDKAVVRAEQLRSVTRSPEPPPPRA